MATRRKPERETCVANPIPTKRPGGPRRLVGVLCGLVGWLSCPLLNAQVIAPKFIALSQEQGLSNNSVTCIYQDRTGFIWIGTRNGLNRYDGHALQVYAKDGEGDFRIPHDNIYDIRDDAQGQLLVVTLNGELLRQDSITHQFRPFFSAAENRRYGFSAMSFLQTYTDRRGTLWLATLRHGLVAFDPKARTARLYTTRSVPAIGGNNAITVLEDSQQRLWVGTNAGVTLLSADRKSSRPYKPPAGLTDKESTHINALFEDRLGRLWIGSGHGIFLMQPGSNELVPLKIPAGPDGLSGAIRTLKDDEHGNVWIGSDNGLFIFDLRKQTLIPVKTSPTQRYALTDQYVFSVCRDRQGAMWVGTYYGGVSINYASATGFDQFEQPRAHDALTGKIIRDIVEDRAGNQWFGLENSGVVGLMNESKTVRRLSHAGSPDQRLLGDQIQGMDDDADGTLWIGSYNRGLNQYNPRTGRVAQFRHEPGNWNSLSSDAVNNVLVDRKGRVWVGTNLGGLNRYDRTRRTFHHYRYSARPGSIDNDQVATLYEDRQGRIWVGTVTGLNRYDEQHDRFVRYPRLNPSGSSAGLYVTAVFEDRRGTLWVGSAGDGLFALNPETGAFRHPQPDRQLANATVYKILEDQNRQLWFSSNTGLYRFDSRSYRYENYTMSDGLVANQFNYNSGSLLTTGQLVFGSVNGYALFDPAHLQKSEYKPAVVITDFRVNNQPAYAVNVAQSPLKAVQLAHDQSTLSFSFVALAYGSHNNERYAVKLDGYDDSWSVPSTNRLATYTRLPPGQYRFRVRATNNGSNWLAASTPVLITIRFPWWQSTWAYVVYVLAAGGLVYVLGRYSVIEINRKKQLLREHYERERDQALGAMKYRFFTSVSHEFRTPLTLIKAPLDDMLAHADGLSRDQLTHHRLTLMKQQVGKMVRLVDQLMDVSKAESGYLKLHPQATDVVALCGQVIHQFDAMASQQTIHLHYIPSVGRQLYWVDADKVEKILYNLLTNAFKYTQPHDRITVRLSQTGDGTGPESHLVIDVDDTGMGIPPADVPRIFERFYQADNQAHLAHKGTGIGLALCRELAGLHGGTVTVRSTPGAGSQFSVSLPVRIPPVETHPLPPEPAPVSANGLADPDSQPRAPLQPTLLLVEDDPDIQAYLRELLGKTYQVISLKNGQEAWSYLQDYQPDLIVSDVTMPLMDGLTFCKKLKSHLSTCHLPVLMLTARTTVEDQMNGLTTGADEYITKPFHPGLLLVRLQNLLANRQLLKDKLRKELILQPHDVTTNSLDEAFLRQVMTLIESNIENPAFNASFLVQSLNMSRSTFYRKLQAITDLSPGDFIREVRLKRAAQLLTRQELTVAEVAYAIGYNDLKTFRQNFQQSFGTTPSTYAKAAQNA